MDKALKESNVFYIGCIPQEWSFSKIKNHFYNKKEIVGDREPDFERLALTLNGVIKKSKTDNSGLQPEKLDGYQILYENELVFKLIDLENIQTSRVGLTPWTGIVSPAYIKLHSIDYDVRYAYYYFTSLYLNNVFNELGGSGVRSAISSEDLLNMYIPELPLSSQKKIADYLDQKTKIINTTIDEIEREISLIEEYKKSVVSKYVKPKDGWKTTKLLNLLSMKITDGPHETPELLDEGIPFISAEAVYTGKIDFSHKRGNISKEYYDECCKKYIPKMNDIYMVKSGGTTGNLAIVETDEIFTIWSPLAVIRVNDENYYKFVFYCLYSPEFQYQIALNWSYGTQQNIGMRTLELLQISYPTKSEQIKIADELDKIFEKANELIDLKKRRIQLIKEYKKSLYYAVVTGKKEV